MPRPSGSKNSQDYKYKVEKLNELNEIINTNYYVTQKEIQDKYNLKRSAVYYILNNPSRRKANDYINISKLDQPMPVFKIVHQEENGDIIFRYNKIDYLLGQ